MAIFCQKMLEMKNFENLKMLTPKTPWGSGFFEVLPPLDNTLKHDSSVHPPYA